LQESKAIFTQIKTILEGKTSVSMFSEFLRRNNKTDLLILKTTKVSSDGTTATSCPTLTLVRV
jgi:26S proteasome regulatory subunit N2